MQSLCAHCTITTKRNMASAVFLSGASFFFSSNSPCHSRFAHDVSVSSLPWLSLSRLLLEGFRNSLRPRLSFAVIGSLFGVYRPDVNFLSCASLGAVTSNQHPKVSSLYDQPLWNVMRPENDTLWKAPWINHPSQRHQYDPFRLLHRHLLPPLSCSLSPDMFSSLLPVCHTRGPGNPSSLKVTKR